MDHTIMIGVCLTYYKDMGRWCVILWKASIIIGRGHHGLDNLNLAYNMVQWGIRLSILIGKAINIKKYSRLRARRSHSLQQYNYTFPMYISNPLMCDLQHFCNPLSYNLVSWVAMGSFISCLYTIIGGSPFVEVSVLNRPP